jgi:hypothetical protein
LKSGMSDIDIAKKHQVEVSFVEKFKWNEQGKFNSKGISIRCKS